MIGKSHVAVNFCSVLSAASAGYILKHHIAPDSELAGSAVGAVRDVFCEAQGVPVYAFVPMAAALFLIGSLLPDCDQERSAAGKYFHLPLGHRTWTHSIWALVLLLLPALYFSPMRWLFLGYVLHLLWDSVSAAGVCLFYPFQRYREYGSGAKVKPGHKLKLYWTGKTSEFVTVGVIITLTLCLCGTAVYLFFTKT